MSSSIVLTPLDIVEVPTGVNVLDSFRLLVVLFFLPGLDTRSIKMLPFPDPTESLGTLVFLNSKGTRAARYVCCRACRTGAVVAVFNLI